MFPQYCYVKTTFTVPNHLHSEIGEKAISAGVGAFDKGQYTYDVC